MKNNLFTFFVVAIIALGIGLFLGTKMVSPQLAPSTFSVEEQQGQVVLMGTPGFFPDRDPLLRTNFFAAGSGAISRIAYVKPDFQNVIQTPVQRACFVMTYLDRNKLIVNVTGLGVANTLCLNEGDNGFVLEVLELNLLPAGNQTNARAIVTAPQIA